MKLSSSLELIILYSGCGYISLRTNKCIVYSSKIAKHFLELGQTNEIRGRLIVADSTLSPLDEPRIYYYLIAVAASIVAAIIIMCLCIICYDPYTRSPSDISLEDESVQTNIKALPCQDLLRVNAEDENCFTNQYSKTAYDPKTGVRRTVFTMGNDSRPAKYAEGDVCPLGLTRLGPTSNVFQRSPQTCPFTKFQNYPKETQYKEQAPPVSSAVFPTNTPCPPCPSCPPIPPCPTCPPCQPYQTCPSCPPCPGLPELRVVYPNPVVSAPPVPQPKTPNVYNTITQTVNQDPTKPESPAVNDQQHNFSQQQYTNVYQPETNKQPAYILPPVAYQPYNILPTACCNYQAPVNQCKYDERKEQENQCKYDGKKEQNNRCQYNELKEMENRCKYDERKEQNNRCQYNELKEMATQCKYDNIIESVANICKFEKNVETCNRCRYDKERESYERYRQRRESDEERRFEEYYERNQRRRQDYIDEQNYRQVYSPVKQPNPVDRRVGFPVNTNTPIFVNAPQPQNSPIYINTPNPDETPRFPDVPQCDLHPLIVDGPPFDNDLEMPDATKYNRYDHKFPLNADAGTQIRPFANRPNAPYRRRTDDPNFNATTQGISDVYSRVNTRGTKTGDNTLSILRSETFSGMSESYESEVVKECFWHQKHINAYSKDRVIEKRCQ